MCVLAHPPEVYIVLLSVSAVILFSVSEYLESVSEKMVGVAAGAERDNEQVKTPSHAHTHTHMHTHTHTHTCTHPQIHTHTCTRAHLNGQTAATFSLVIV